MNHGRRRVRNLNRKWKNQKHKNFTPTFDWDKWLELYEFFTPATTNLWYVVKSTFFEILKCLSDNHLIFSHFKSIFEPADVAHFRCFFFFASTVPTESTASTARAARYFMTAEERRVGVFSDLQKSEFCVYKYSHTKLVLHLCLFIRYCMKRKKWEERQAPGCLIKKFL